MTVPTLHHHRRGPQITTSDLLPEMQPPRQARWGPGRSGKRRIVVLLIGIAAAIAVLGIGIWAAQRNAIRARLMISNPDSISGDAELNRYALSEGRHAFAAHCASCHGRHLEGDRQLGIPNLADNDWLYGTGRVSEIERIILYGIRSGHPKAWNLASMPAYATPNPYKAYKIEPLTPREVNDAAAYLYAFRHKPPDPDAAARGAKVFSKTGQCFDCHGPDARGDPAIGAPDLTDATWLYGDGSLPSIALSIADGRAGACPAWSDRLSPATIRAIALYVYAAGTAKAMEHE
jgi:cytochrome c oxidase cbb3-type subunit 3